MARRASEQAADSDGAAAMALAKPRWPATRCGPPSRDVPILARFTGLRQIKVRALLPPRRPAAPVRWRPSADLLSRTVTGRSLAQHSLARRSPHAQHSCRFLEGRHNGPRRRAGDIIRQDPRLKGELEVVLIDDTDRCRVSTRRVEDVVVRILVARRGIQLDVLLDLIFDLLKNESIERLGPEPRNGSLRYH